MKNLKILKNLLTEDIPINGDPQFNQIKSQAKKEFERIGFPNQRNEFWKYNNLTKILEKNYSFSSPVQFRSDYELSKTPHDLNLGLKSSPFSYLNTVHFENAGNLIIDQKIDEHISLSYTVESFCHPRINIHLKENASATIFLKTDAKNKGFSNQMIDIKLDKNAELQLVFYNGINSQDQFSSLVVDLEENAKFQSVVYTHNNDFTRHDTEINFNAENAKAALSGVVLLNQEQNYFNHLKINHNVGNCECKQLFKTILTDSAVSEFTGIVFIEKNAHGINSSQLNQNLLLSNGARALSRPQLLIDTDDVECSHGATVGQLNKDEIFYIKSRGLTEMEAKQLLTFGFAEDVLDNISSLKIRKELSNILNKEIYSYVNS
ncbi:MAG: SufD family Fe-S cluster assembly protein [bacterium]|nr:SufD family Fe-S cluster assembly protein [bacterium]